MSNLLQYPKFQAFDSDGAPLSGGKLYTYIAGTTTAKATYSDRELTSANANPVILDSRGEAVVHFRGRIKLVLTDSADAAVWTRDNVEGVPQSKNIRFVDAAEADQGAAGSGNSLKDLIDDIGTSLYARLIFRHDQGAANTTTFTLSTDETIPSNIEIEVDDGARIDIDTGVTLTIEGPVRAGAYQIFSGLGTVDYSASPGLWHNEWESGGSGVKIASLELLSGATVDGISDDTLLADDAADELVTEHAVKTYIDNKLPVGFPATWLAETPPDGWLERDGSTISRNTYADLFAVIGTKYGEGDGISTFELPDDRGKFPRYWDHGAGVDPDAASRTGSDPLAGAGNVTGDHVGTNQADELKSHVHEYEQSSTRTDISGNGAQTTAYSSTNPDTGSTGGNETRLVNVYEMPIIKY